jgi:N-acetyl-anhydromuramyl-L-alanine amidase AmpD
MRRLVSASCLPVALALALSACAMELDDGSATEDLDFESADPASESSLRKPEVLEHLFAQAADEFQVPAELLKAVSYVETRWEMVEGDEELEGMPAASGLLALRGDALTRGATLAGVSASEARTDALANLRAGAALLSSYADELGLDRSDLGAWAPALARLSGIDNSDALATYIHDEVYGVMNQGAMAYTLEGELAVALAATKVEPDFAAPEELAKAAGPDYANSIWRPSPNYNARPSGDIGKPGMVVIHTCEGTYAGCWGWLTNSSSSVSAHYVVKEDGSEISQLVRETDRAWHIGASYDCSLNGNVECWRNGYSSNHFTVGIEHAGYASQSSFPAGQIDASARLVCDITRDRGIARDSYHIVAHGRLQPYNRTDPGPNWPWSNYLSLINSHCGSSSSSIIIDSNNNNNDTAKGYIQTSANWTGSSNVAGYYGTGYYWGATQAISDGASFWFYLPSAATKTVDAWWTAASDRSTSAPFIAYDSSGAQLGTKYVNQQSNGGKWNTLGTYSFKAGWNRIMLSRWTTAGYVVIADAVRIR